MKVFVSGTKFIKTDNNLRWALPETIRESLDDLMAEETEVLIGDCIGVDSRVQEYLYSCEYQNVRIYVSGSKNSTRYNVGKWAEEHFRINTQTRYAHRLEKDFRMAEDADLGIAIWDGESKGTFTNMVYLAAQGKPIRLYLIKESRWVNINNIEKLEPFAGEEGVFGESEIRRVMTECGFSDEMIEYSILNNTISFRQLIDAICGAPISIDKKQYLLSFLGKRRNIKWEIFHSVLHNLKSGNNTKIVKHDIRAIADNREKDSAWTYIWNLYREIDKAKENDINLSETMGMQHYLFSEWYDIEDKEFKSSPCGMFSYPEAAVDYMRREWSDFEPEEKKEIEESEYYRMETWDPYDSRWQSPRYDYYYYKGEICWFEKLRPVEQTNGNVSYITEDNRFAGGKSDLNIKTPYKPGDVVLIDCRPFGPPFYAMILEARHQDDSCFPNIIFKIPGTDKWRITSLKHKLFYESKYTYWPMLSPLYRLRSIAIEDVSGDEKEYVNKLFELRELFFDDEEAATIIWNKWHESSIEDMSEKEVDDLFYLD